MKKSKANTRFGYMYRDGSNYKTGWSVVFKGELKSDTMKEFLEQKLKSFIPSQIGLEDLQGALQEYDSKDYGDDHCWHEFSGIETTEQEADDSRTIHQFVKEVIKVEFKEFEVGHILNQKR